MLLAEALLCIDIAHFTSTIKKSAVFQSIETFLKQLSSILAGGRWKENDTQLAAQIDFYCSQDDNVSQFNPESNTDKM